MYGNSLKIAAISLLCVFTLAQIGYAQEEWSCAGTNNFNCDIDDSNVDQNDYSTIDYHYYGSHHRGHRGGSDRNFRGYINFGRKFDNSDRFSSGISSYQGTSTGPGPNGGYPGTPRGTYQTHYFNTAIYPNTYMQTYSR